MKILPNPNTTKSKINPKSQIQILGFGNWDLFGSIGNIGSIGIFTKDG